MSKISFSFEELQTPSKSDSPISLSKTNAMKVIVPVDFSDASLNAAEFTAQMLQDRYGATMILYHVYRSEENPNTINERLERLQDIYQIQFEVKIDYETEQGDDFIGCLTHFVRSQEADLLVMAVTDRIKILDASFSLQMVAQSVCPVLVIPPGFSYKEVKNVALACDFRNVQQLIPVVPVMRILRLFNPSLHIVNVNSEIYVSLNEQQLEQKQILQEMFSEYKPEFHFINTYDFHKSLRRFVADKSIDLVLTFPRKHSFFNYLIKGNNTKKLVYESEVPVLAAHE